jgi:hypothetical protein
MSLHSALRLLRARGTQARAQPQTDPAETAAAQAIPDSAAALGPPVGDRVTPSAWRRSQPYNPLPSDEDDEATRWAKVKTMRHGGEGMGSLIYATRPRNLDRGNTSALAKDAFNPWRE